MENDWEWEKKMEENNNFHKKRRKIQGLEMEEFDKDKERDQQVGGSNPLSTLLV